MVELAAQKTIDKMAIAKTRIHIICGICGNNEMMSYKIVTETADNNQQVMNVIICCKNSSSITNLEEVMKKEVKEND